MTIPDFIIGLGNNLVINSILYVAVCGCKWIRDSTYYYLCMVHRKIILFSEHVLIGA